jgi:hypothetical protein
MGLSEAHGIFVPVTQFNPDRGHVSEKAWPPPMRIRSAAGLIP